MGLNVHASSFMLFVALFLLANKQLVFETIATGFKDGSSFRAFIFDLLDKTIHLPVFLVYT